MLSHMPEADEDLFMCGDGMKKIIPPDLSLISPSTLQAILRDEGRDMPVKKIRGRNNADAKGTMNRYCTRYGLPDVESRIINIADLTFGDILQQKD